MAASRTRSRPARPTTRSAGTGSPGWAFEVAEQERELGVFFDTIVVCSVTGSTQAGMIAGFAVLEDAGGRPRRVIGVDGSATPVETRDQVARIARRTAASIGLERELRDDEIVLDDRYHEGTYGIPGPGTLEAMRLAARLEGMITDPVYEGKSMAGLIDLVARGEIGPRIECPLRPPRRAAGAQRVRLAVRVAGSAMGTSTDVGRPHAITLATVGTTGDVRPFLVLGRALAAAGHDVRVVTWPMHRAAVAAAGLAVETAGPQADPAEIDATARAARGRDAMGQVEVLRDFHLRDGAAHARRLRELLDGAELVVLHSIHALAHAAVLDLRVPWATAVFDPVLLPTRTAPPPGMPSLGPANVLAWRLLDRALARSSAPLDAVLADAGSAQRGLPLFRARSSRLHLVACSPALITVPPDLPPTTHVTGAWLDRSPNLPLPAAVEAFLTDGPAPVVITFGSMGGVDDEVIAEAVERLAGDGLRVIVQGGAVPSKPAVLALGPGPVDHRRLFARASVVVHHGGAGTTHTAVGRGRPVGRRAAGRRPALLGPAARGARDGAAGRRRRVDPTGRARRRDPRHRARHGDARTGGRARAPARARGRRLGGRRLVEDLLAAGAT